MIKKRFYNNSCYKKTCKNIISCNKKTCKNIISCHKKPFKCKNTLQNKKNLSNTDILKNGNTISLFKNIKLVFSLPTRKKNKINIFKKSEILLQKNNKNISDTQPINFNKEKSLIKQQKKIGGNIYTQEYNLYPSPFFKRLTKIKNKPTDEEMKEIITKNNLSLFDIEHKTHNQLYLNKMFQNTEQKLAGILEGLTNNDNIDSLKKYKITVND